MNSSFIIHLSCVLLIPCAFALKTGSQIKSTCGFPGSPQHGRVLHLLENYTEGMVITYECEPDYYLLGPVTRTCLPNGTWSNTVPVCDQSVKVLGLTSASEALNNYPPQLAVDGNFRTCFFSNRRKPRWWRVELPKASMHNQSIISVAITLPPINAELFFSIYVIEVETLSSTDNETTVGALASSTSSKYHKCATFRGVFSSKTIMVQCAGSTGGLRGNYLQIEDDYPQLEYFGLCEVDVFIERETYPCGQAEVPANGYILDREEKQIKTIEYHCQEGYQLIGDSTRTCNLKTGQWLGSEPICERITCTPPETIQNGLYQIFGNYYDLAVVGTRTVYECQPGFTLIGNNNTMVCDLNGQWSGVKPHCEAVDCGHPESLIVNVEDFMLSGAHFRLPNGTTKYSAVAELVCPSPEGHHRSNQSQLNLSFRCREDGVWTEIKKANVTETKSSACIKQRHNGFLYYYGSVHKTGNSKLRKSFYIRETSVNMLHLLAAVVIAAFLSICIIVVLLFKRSIIEWPEELCSPFAGRAKATGQSIAKWITDMLVSIQSVMSHKFSHGQSQDCKPAPFTITPSTSDIESARSQQEESTVSNDNKDDLNSALATFYEEITSAAKQVFAEDTDRKLLRAARIAAELDAIKSQQESNYHWIYATPPRFASSSLPPSLTPSVHESSQIPSTGQIYAKVDLIRKHRYRKEKETSVYQVPKPLNVEYDPNHSLISQSSIATSAYQLRKAFSSPESVFLESEYATIRQLNAIGQVHSPYSQLPATNQTPERINRFPLKTLL